MIGHRLPVLAWLFCIVFPGCADSAAPPGGNNPTVSTVAVVPGSASVNVQQVVQLIATSKDANGNTVAGATAAWTTSDPAVATVNNGLVTGMAQGTATITATSQSKTGSASITVNPLMGPVPNTLFEELFEDASFASRGWYDFNAGWMTSVTTAEHIPGSTKSLEAHFSVGGVNSNPRVQARHLFTANGTVYLRYWVKYSTNWVGSGKPYHPHEFQFVTNVDGDYIGPSWSHLTTYIEHRYVTGGAVAVLAAQDGQNIDVTNLIQSPVTTFVDPTTATQNRAVSGCNGISDPPVQLVDCYQVGPNWFNGKEWKSPAAVFTATAGPGYKNDWHKVEVLYQLNSIQGGKGVADGIAQYWFDGQLVIDKQNVLFRTGNHPTMKFNQFLMTPYMGDGSPADQKMWIDDLIVMDGKP